MTGKKIYIVEDDSIIKLVLEDLISSMGHVIVGSASNADAAYSGIEKTTPDLIILDIGLQGQRDGVDLANHINESLMIPFVYVTGNSDSITISRARRTHPRGFIFKPFDEGVFIAELGKLIEGI